ncbi:MAG: hypothetical protein ACK4UO_00380 [Pseudolabrys sp.]
MVKPPDEFPKRIDIAYNDAIGNLKFFKNQQWQITRYVLLADAALFAFKVTLESAAATNEWPVNLALIASAILAGIFACAAVITTEFSIRKQRRRLEWIYEKYFPAEEIDGLILKPGTGFFNKYGFVTGFCFTIAFGTVLAAIAICKIG